MDSVNGQRKWTAYMNDCNIEHADHKFLLLGVTIVGGHQLIKECEQSTSVHTTTTLGRVIHRSRRECGISEPKGWTEDPKSKVLQGREDDQGIMVDAESDSALMTDPLGTENVVSVTEFLVE
jgi:hypothetical protein